MRARADSVANGLFLVAGGALSVSIAVLLGADAPRLGTVDRCLLGCAWMALAYSIISFAWIKTFLIVQAYKDQSGSPYRTAWHATTTCINWTLGITGLAAFTLGLILLVIIATRAVGAIPS
jgi:hypothetical protein